MRQADPQPLTAAPAGAQPPTWAPAGRVRLRPRTGEDAAFLLGVFASTRPDELAALPADPATRAAFVGGQAGVQEAHFRAAFTDLRYQIVEVDGAPAGRLVEGRRPRALVVADVSLLPEYRGRGVGTALLRGVQDRAAVEGREVRLHVLAHSPARRLYGRLGFADLGGQLHVEMVWRPRTAPSPSSLTPRPAAVPHA